MEIINNVLFRTPDKDHFLSNMITWPDNSNPNAWYYEAVQEATNSHEYTVDQTTGKDTCKTYNRTYRKVDTTCDNNKSHTDPQDAIQCYVFCNHCQSCH